MLTDKPAMLAQLSALQPRYLREAFKALVSTGTPEAHALLVAMAGRPVLHHAAEPWPKSLEDRLFASAERHRGSELPPHSLLPLPTYLEPEARRGMNGKYPLVQSQPLQHQRPGQKHPLKSKQPEGAERAPFWMIQPPNSIIIDRQAIAPANTKPLMMPKFQSLPPPKIDEPKLQRGIEKAVSSMPIIVDRKAVAAVNRSPGSEPQLSIREALDRLLSMPPVSSRLLREQRTSGLSPKEAGALLQRYPKSLQEAFRRLQAQGLDAARMKLLSRP